MVTENCMLVAVIALPGLYLLARAVIAAYFEAKLRYHRRVLPILEKADPISSPPNQEV